MRRTTAIVVAVIAAMTLTLTACGGSGTNATGSGGSETGASRKGDPEDRDDELHRLFQPVELHRVPGVQRLHHGLSPARPVRLQGRRIHDCGRPRESWDTSSDGKTWTFHLHTGTKWSDDSPSPRTTSRTINTTVKYAAGPTAVMAPSLNHVKDATAPDPATVVINYKAPVGNALAQLEQFVLPQHVWEQYATGDGKGLKTHHPEQDVGSMVTGGASPLSPTRRRAPQPSSPIRTTGARRRTCRRLP